MGILTEPGRTGRRPAVSVRRGRDAAGAVAARTAATLLLAVTLPSAAPVRSATAQPAERPARPSGGFAEPVALIPELGLWVDGLAELGYAERPGLVLWWDLAGPRPGSALAGGPVDWRRVTYRVRAEVLGATGKRAGRVEELIEPLRADAYAERGGFPTATHLTIAPGRYTVRLEAYPLIAAEAAGLAEVPRGAAEVEATIPAAEPGSEWRVSDLLFLDGLAAWQPGAPSARTWYEWVVSPNVPRSFAADSAGAFLAFEVLRGEDVVPRCRLNTCRVQITVSDAAGGIVYAALRAVPEAESVSAYAVPFQTAGWDAGVYRAEVEVWDGSQLLAAVSRPFRVGPPPG